MTNNVETKIRAYEKEYLQLIEVKSNKSDDELLKIITDEHSELATILGGVLPTTRMIIENHNPFEHKKQELSIVVGNYLERQTIHPINLKHNNT